jgi:prophage tail gpP-like protein
VTDDITIVAGGKRLEGILRFELRAPVEGMPHSFRWTITERFAGQVSQIVVTPRTKCQVFLGADQVLEGWIDRYQPYYDKQQHTVQILGRGLCEDVVDCPVNIFKTGWQLEATTILQAAHAIASPFNLTVVMGPGVANVTLPPEMQKVAIYPGIPAYGFLEEYCRSVGLLMYEDETGQIVLSTGGAAGRAGSAVIEGANVERVEGMISTDQRFADYYVFSQDRSLLDVGDAIIAHQKDPQAALLAPRLRIILQEFPDVGLQFSLRRALWEANRRWGRSQLVRATITGWRDGQGALYKPNSIISVSLPSAKTSGDRVITEVAYQRDELGTRSVLTLMPQQALLVQPFTIATPV